MNSVGRKGKTGGFVRVFVAFQNGKALTRLIHGGYTGALPPVLCKVEGAFFVIRWVEEPLNLIRLSVQQRSIIGGLVRVRVSLEI